MDILSNAELNKLKNVKYILEKRLKNILERYEESLPHFGTELMEHFGTFQKTRTHEESVIKKEIQIITETLRSKMCLFKNNKIGEIKDFKIFQQEMVDIQESIFNTKHELKSTLKNLGGTEVDLNDELNLYYNGKVAEWSVPLNVNMNSELVTAKVKSKNSGQCKEVKEFFDYVHRSGGHENGWRQEDHLLFLKLRSKYKKVDVVASHLHDTLPDITIDEIKSHEEWYAQYLDLQSKKRNAINKWKQNKNAKSLDRHVSEVESNKGIYKYKEEGTKLREKLMQWKIEREQRTEREREFEKQKMLDKIEKARLQKQKQLEIKSIVNEWRESKIVLEETKKQHKKMLEKVEQRKKAALANRLIRQFQSMDDLHIIKMRQIHKKLTEEKPKRVKSGPAVMRDPTRLFKPTMQWAQRVKASKDPGTRVISILSMPKLAIPDWRKTIA